jgi:acetyl esterase
MPSPPTPARSAREGVRRRLVTAAIDGGLQLSGGLARRLPYARPDRYGLERIADVDYTGTGDPHHRLDVYRRSERTGLLPAVMYVHGGAFRMLSKDSHFMMGLTYASAGYVVFNINYRLAPRHRWPAQLEDAVAAYRFIVEHAEEFGADPQRIVLAGESAGANMVLALAIASSFERPEPFASEMLQCAVRPAAVAPACGLFQVTDVQRFERRRSLPWWIREYLASIPEACIDDAARASAPSLLDPLLVLESEATPRRPLPPVWLGVGTADPVLDDTRRLARALERRAVTHRAEYYPRGVHAFHAVLPLALARRFWHDQLRFLSQHLR